MSHWWKNGMILLLLMFGNPEERLIGNVMVHIHSQICRISFSCINWLVDLSHWCDGISLGLGSTEQVLIWQCSVNKDGRLRLWLRLQDNVLTPIPAPTPVAKNKLTPIPTLTPATLTPTPVGSSQIITFKTFLDMESWTDSTSLDSGSDSDSRQKFWLRLRFRLHLSEKSWLQFWLQLVKKGMDSSLDSDSGVGTAHLCSVRANGPMDAEKCSVLHRNNAIHHNYLTKTM